MKLGTASWMPDTEAAGRYLYRDGAVWLGRLRDDAPIGYADDRHVCLVSGTRGGKGASLIVNNLCLWPGSVVVVDPKGDNATITAARRGQGSAVCEGMSQAVHVLDPFQAADVESHYRSRFNPLDALDPEREESIDEAARLADALVVVKPDSKDPYWDESARMLVKGLLLHVATAPYFEGQRNLVTVRELITRGDQKGRQVRAESGVSEEDLRSAQSYLWEEVALNPAFDGILAGIGETVRSLYEHSPKQFESVLQIANRNTEFLDSPAMRRCVEVSDFELADLKRRPEGMSLFLCLPQRYMNTHYRWLRMMVALTVTEMEITRGRPASGAPVLMVLDEFAGLRRMEIIESAVAQIAGFGVKLFFVLQSLEQLKATYKDNWETFLSNAGLRVFFGLDDHFSREYVSKLIGEMEVIRTVKSTGTSRTTSETNTTSRSTSETTSRSTGQSTSKGTSHSQGRSESHGTSVSDSESESQTQSSSETVGSSESVGVSYKKIHFLNRDDVRFSESGSSSHSQTSGRSSTTGRSRTTGASHNEGTSENWGTNESTSRSTTDGTSWGTTLTEGTSYGTTEGTTTGEAETVHKRALISPDELGRILARIDDSEDGRYPGMALVLIAGQSPLLVRRVNYFEDLQFIARFSRHQDFAFRPPRLLEISARIDKPEFLHSTSWIAEALIPAHVIVPKGLPLFRVIAQEDTITELDAPDDARVPVVAEGIGPGQANLRQDAGGAYSGTVTLAMLLHYNEVNTASLRHALHDGATRRVERVVANPPPNNLAALLATMLPWFGVILLTVAVTRYGFDAWWSWTFLGALAAFGGRLWLSRLASLRRSARIVVENEGMAPSVFVEAIDTLFDARRPWASATHTYAPDLLTQSAAPKSLDDTYQPTAAVEWSVEPDRVSADTTEPTASTPPAGVGAAVDRRSLPLFARVVLPVAAVVLIGAGVVVSRPGREAEQHPPPEPVVPLDEAVRAGWRQLGKIRAGCFTGTEPYRSFRGVPESFDGTAAVLKCLIDAAFADVIPRSPGNGSQAPLKFGPLGAGEAYYSVALEWAVTAGIPAAGDPAFRAETQVVYERELQRFARAYYFVGRKAERQPACFDSQLDAYKNAMADGGGRPALVAINQFLMEGYCDSVGREPFWSPLRPRLNEVFDREIVFFWQRRDQDGTAGLVRQGLRKLLRTYDGAWLDTIDLTMWKG